MSVPTTLRGTWSFRLPLTEVLTAAERQKKAREDRIAWWTNMGESVMQEIKDSGIEIKESISFAKMSYNARGHNPQVQIRTDLQDKIIECHDRIKFHKEDLDRYNSWIAFLKVGHFLNDKAGNTPFMDLTYDDYNFFFKELPGTAIESEE